MAITQIHIPRKVRTFLVYDLEWVPGLLDVRICGVFDGTRYRSYRTIDAFLDAELTSKNRGKWFYAHAGGMADIQFVFAAILKRKGYSVKAAFSGSSAIIVHISRGKNSWHFIDSYWLLRDKLANIGKSIGMLKGIEDDENPEDSEEIFQAKQVKKKNWYANAPIAELRDYNEQDCRILWTAIDAFETAILGMGGQLQMTLASSAMHLFRRRYLKQDIPTNERVNEQARKAYFASRVEVFNTHVEDSYYYDINSSFPYAMTKPCPGAYIGASRRIPDKDDGMLYLADCTIEIPDTYFPTTPTRIQGRTFFPIGRWRSWLTNVDLELLRREGGNIISTHEVLLFEPFEDLAEYCTDIYSKRKASTDEFQRTVYKLLLNSLYGKFAESPFKQGLLIDPSPQALQQEGLKMLMPGVWLQEREIPVPHVHVPISAHITALARRTIYDYMAQCSEFHYCDTDGFSTTQELPTSKELGGLKLEKMIKSGLFVAPKVYMIQGQELANDGTWADKTLTKAKGFSRMNVSRFMKLVEGETIEFERMRRLRELYRKGSIDPEEYNVKKRLNIANYLPKRYTYPDGFTRPWHIDELRNALPE